MFRFLKYFVILDCSLFCVMKTLVLIIWLYLCSLPGYCFTESVWGQGRRGRLTGWYLSVYSFWVWVWVLIIFRKHHSHIHSVHSPFSIIIKPVALTPSYCKQTLPSCDKSAGQGWSTWLLLLVTMFIASGTHPSVGIEFLGIKSHIFNSLIKHRFWVVAFKQFNQHDFCLV